MSKAYEFFAYVKSLEDSSEAKDKRIAVLEDQIKFMQGETAIHDVSFWKDEPVNKVIPKLNDTYTSDQIIEAYKKTAVYEGFNYYSGKSIVDTFMEMLAGVHHSQINRLTRTNVLFLNYKITYANI
jgi:hypothetical protein